jgi:lupus La protein
MSALPVEATEPDPATTSLPNDETVNKEGGNTSAPTEKDAEMPDAESKEANGAAGLKEENGDDKSEKSGAIKKEQLSPKSSRRQYDNKNRRENNSKYDPSVLPTTDDHKKIRAQVSNKTFKLHA